MTGDQLVLAIDGGGTKTVAWLARGLETGLPEGGRRKKEGGIQPSAFSLQQSPAPRPPSPVPRPYPLVPEPAGDPSVVGRAVAGPANPQTVGFTQATENLDRVVAAAFHDAALEIEPVTAAVLALAGSGREENRRAFERWAQRRRLARRFRVVNDALPVLVAGSPDGWGVALIAGTGSLAFGQTRDGRTARAGGWGFRFGDEGSGYAIAVAGLRAAAKSADGRGPPTRLLKRLLDRLALTAPAELIPAISQIASDRAAFAALAEVVTKTAGEGDAVAEQIVNEAAGELAAMTAAVVRQLDLPASGFPIALAGGALLASENLQRCLMTQVGLLGLLPHPVTKVPEPVAGALMLAKADAT
jgi:N-acetylmuramic acid 6-phosphate etherase